jgi:hypothetical protein
MKSNPVCAKAVYTCFSGTLRYKVQTIITIIKVRFGEYVLTLSLLFARFYKTYLFIYLFIYLLCFAYF